MIKAERIYHLSGGEPQYKILVDGIWPRGIKKEDPRIDEWLKDIAPDKALRRWFFHDPDRWEEFREAYRKQLQSKRELLERIKKTEQTPGVSYWFMRQKTTFTTMPWS